MKAKLYILITMLLACSLQVKADTSDEVTVGTNSKDVSSLGLCCNYKNSANEVLYLSNEIGRSGYISKIAYYVEKSSGTVPGCTVKIYMAETEKDQIDNTSAGMVDASVMAEVYSYTNYTVGKVLSGWEEITLDVPFYYSGTKNLVVAVSTSKPDYVYVQIKGCAKTNRAVCKKNDSYSSYSEVNYTSMSLYNDGIPYTKFTFAGEVKDVEVGSNSGNDNNVGLCPWYWHSGTQTLYTKSQLGNKGGIISEISYYVEDIPSSSSIKGRVKMYMAETSNDNLKTGDNANMITSADAMTLVYDSGEDGYKLPTTTGWERFRLTRPFHYSGTKNLILAMEVTKDGYTSSVKYRYTSASEVSVHQHGDGKGNEAYGSAFVPGKSGSFTNANMYLDTKFTFADDVKTVGTGNRELIWGGITARTTASQHLYLAKEIGRTGTISRISYHVASATTDPIDDLVEIYMAEVPYEKIITEEVNNSLKKSQMTLVFNGSIRLKPDMAGKWLDVNLTKEFNYSGTGNLVVAVVNSATTDSNWKLYSTSNIQRTVYSTGGRNDVDSLTVPYGFLPNIRFTFEEHGTCTTYSDNGFGVCPNCHKELQYEFQAPQSIPGLNGGYYLKNVGNLKWIAKNINKGAINNRRMYFMSNDIDLTGYSWTPIGSAEHPYNCIIAGYSYSTNNGHTLKGIANGNYLVGTMQNPSSQTYLPYLASMRLESGTLVKNGISGCINQCLTLGHALVESNKGLTINSSFYLEPGNEPTEYGRTANQMASGEVTYALNSYRNRAEYAKWYQNIDVTGKTPDPYPMVSNSSEVVHQYTKCSGVAVYTNANREGKEAHDFLNGICTREYCKAEPDHFDEDINIVDESPYLRTIEATVNGDLTYTRTFNEEDVNKWQALFIPLAGQYTKELSELYDIAEIHHYGVMEDTNGDNVVNTMDDKMLVGNLLAEDAVILPNTPYLIRPRTAGEFVFTSGNGILYSGNDKQELNCSTMKENFSIKGDYSRANVSTDYMLVQNGSLVKATNDNMTLYPFRWFVKPTYRNGGKWDKDNVGIAIDRFEYKLIDDEKTPYTLSREITVNDFSYKRTFEDRQIGHWQSMYVPFDIYVDQMMDEWMSFATIDGFETDSKGNDYLIATKLGYGSNIAANTPFLVRVNQEDILYDGVWSYDLDLVTLKPAESTSMDYMSDNHTYTITGVYEPYDPHAKGWYAIGKGDGAFHPASATAKLPAYRFYLTVDGGSYSGELRIGFRENDFSTGIHTMSDDEADSAIYTLDGRLVKEESLQPGSIYVQNGKKFRVQ